MERERGGETQRKAEDRERKSKRVRCVTGKLNQEIGQDDRGRVEGIQTRCYSILHTDTSSHQRFDITS